MQFIGHEISVRLPSGFSLEKKPPVPEAFEWQGNLYTVAEMLAMWHRYGTAGDTNAGRATTLLCSQWAHAGILGSGPGLLPRANGERAAV